MLPCIQSTCFFYYMPIFFRSQNNRIHINIVCCLVYQLLISKDIVVQSGEATMPQLAPKIYFEFLFTKYNTEIYNLETLKRSNNLTCLFWSCLSIYICPSVIYPVRSGVGCVISEQIKIYKTLRSCMAAKPRTNNLRDALLSMKIHYHHLAQSKLGFV